MEKAVGIGATGIMKKGCRSDARACRLPHCVILPCTIRDLQNAPSHIARMPSLLSI